MDALFYLKGEEMKVTNLAKLFLISLGLLGACKNQSNEPFELVWSYDYTKPAEALSLVALPPLILDGQHVLMAPDEQVSLLDADDGSLIWSFAYPSGQWIGNNEFLEEEGKLYLSEHKSNELYQISLNNGDVLWKKILEGKEFFEGQNDGIDGAYIYVIGRYNEVFRFTKTGELDKTYDILDFGIDDRARSIRILENQLIFSQFFRKEELSHDSGRILSIDKETEEILWEYRTDNGGFIFEPILLEEEIIYAGVTDGPGEFVALNANNGEVIWKTLDVIGQSYTLTDSMVLVNDGISLLALDKFTGKELWNTGLAFGGGDGGDNIGYQNGYVYHAHSGRLYILDVTNGEIVHTEERSPDGSPFQLLAVGDGKVFIQTFNALHAYTVWE